MWLLREQLCYCLKVTKYLRNCSWLFNNALNIENTLVYENQIATKSESENSERDYIKLFRVNKNQTTKNINNDQYDALICKI
jgi:hypothetical protein